MVRRRENVDVPSNALTAVLLFKGVFVLEVPAALRLSAGKTVQDDQGKQICDYNE